MIAPASSAIQPCWFGTERFRIWKPRETLWNDIKQDFLAVQGQENITKDVAGLEARGTIEIKGTEGGRCDA